MNYTTTKYLKTGLLSKIEGNKVLDLLFIHLLERFFELISL